MRTTTTTRVLLALAIGAALPFLVSAGIPVPSASPAACCNVADADPPPQANGDEDFFSIPGGMPNVMILVDDSGSMMDLPQAIGTYPTFSANGGTCAGHWLNNYTSKRKSTPYDNGFNNTLVTDSPPWGLTKCQAKQVAPAADGGTDYCLFRPTSYYKVVHDTGTNATPDRVIGITPTTVKTYNANPCAATDTSGAVLQDWTSGSAKPALAKSVAECTACLASAGFYMFHVTYKVSKTGGTTTSPNQIVFAGDFLNGFPPKFVAARQVVKAIANIDPANPRNSDQVRLGLTGFNVNDQNKVGTSLFSDDGGKLLVPLGPNCDQSFPPVPANYAAARQTIIDTVNAVDATDSNPTYLTFATFTPLAETLFNIGQYFSGTGATGLYTTNFGSGWMRTSTTDSSLNFQETSAGAVKAAWASSGTQHSFCWACQTSSVVIITDGAPTNDTNLPNASATSNHGNLYDTGSKTYDFRKWTNTTIDCPACGGAYLPKVAYFLSQTDLRPELNNDARQQTVSVYTISFGLDPVADATAVAVLQKTALLGGGDYYPTNDADSLAAALDSAVGSVVSRTTAFSSANTNSIQLSRTSSADAYLARFRPNNSSMWEGHLFAAQLFDEVGEGCDERFTTVAQKTVACGTDPAKNPNIDGDLYPSGAPNAGNAVCQSVYMVDKECDPIVEDSTGNFKKGHFSLPDKDTGATQLIGDPDDAVMYWDAGKALSNTADPGYRSAGEDPADATRRKIYTVIDVNADGKLNAADGLVEFTAANAAALAPMMNLAVAPSTSLAFDCKTWLNQIGVCGTAPLPACPAAASDLRTKCAEQIIYFYRGYDVMDWDGDHCGGPGNYYNTNPWGSCTINANCGAEATCTGGKCVNNSCPATGEQRDRERDSRAVADREFWKLGDIFHSSPVVVRPPFDKGRCSIRNTQCLPTLYSAGVAGSSMVTTPLDPSGSPDAYDSFLSTTINRPQVVVVGANDGMLHAFDAGSADKSQPVTLTGQYPYTVGNAAELWAFIPPDLLPRLKDGLTRHIYGVDGSTMVKDIWVDLNKDGKKQANEFKTVGVITERSGGTRWTALDLTDPTAPKFLWTFPQPCSEDSKLIGQSWTEFLPRPSPILPVRLVATAVDPAKRGFEERWIVMVNGGYDPAMVRGRAVWMLDAWYGNWLWRYTDADFKAMRGNSMASMFPVPASIGLVDLGSGGSSLANYDNDGYYDTATWGDMGGNLFVARFDTPGILDSNGHVTNWTASRAFEAQRQVDDSQKIQDRGEIFFMTGNGIDPGNTGRLITTFGTGDREKLMQTKQSCGPDNVLGCCWSGCTVTSSAASSFGAGSCSQGGTFQCSAAGLTYTPAATTGCTAQGAPPQSCGTTSNTVTLNFACGAAGTRTVTTKLVCGSDGVCTTDLEADNSEFSTAALAKPNQQYRAYGLWAYGVDPSKTFSTADKVTAASTAKAFDGQRATDLPFTGCTATPTKTCELVETDAATVKTTAAGVVATCQGTATSCSATGGTDLGWMYSYGKFCPLDPASCDKPSWTDERTGSAVVPWFGCVQFSGFRPTGATSGAGTDPCVASSGTPTSIAYQVDAFSGVPRKGCAYSSTAGTSYFAGQKRNAPAAPQNASERIVLSPTGKVNYSTLKVEAGSPAQKQNLKTRSSVSEPLYWLEVPRTVHSCRHDPAATASACE